MEEKALAGDFTQGSIANKLIRFMIPILGALVLQAMYGAVDLLVVGQFGTDAGISAVSTGSNVINLVTFVISELTMGVTVLIGRYLGENRNERWCDRIFCHYGCGTDGITAGICPAVCLLAECPKRSV